MQFLDVYDLFESVAHVEGLCYDFESLFDDVRDVLQVRTLKNCHSRVGFHVFQNFQQLQVLREHVSDDIHAHQDYL